MAETAWPLKTFPPRGPMRHWHTVGLDIPRQVARLQSLTPLLQATVILPWRKMRHNEQANRRELAKSGSGGFTSRSRAGLRLHPGDRHGALRRRRCEWEQPYTLSWRSAKADDAEWMFGQSRSRLCPGLDRGPLMDVGPERAGHFSLRAQSKGPERADLRP